MSQVLYEHSAHTATAAAADLRHHISAAAAAAAAAGTTRMAAGSDPEPVEEPVATGDAKSHHQSHSSHTTATHYVGLPYQDHNYGAPPPPTPPQSPPPVPVATAPVFTIPGTNGILDVEKPIAVPSLIPPDIPIIPPAPAPAEIPAEHKDEGETRCICTFDHDDGYMICCDRCGVWQHVECMGLDRNNIPDKYFCEKCQPRQVDRIKAHELQRKKREFIINNSDSSSDSGEEEAPASANTTYMAISNSPTSLTLTTAAKYKKLKKKKKKRSKEHIDDKHHKKKKRRHSRKLSGKSDDTPSTIQIMDEEARPPWSDTEEHHDRYEEAAFNQYSADIQHLVATHCQKQAPSINSIRQPKLRTLGQKAEFGKLGKCGVGLVATDDLKKNEFIIEYKGKVMLSEQLEKKLPFFNSPNPHILMYSKFSKLDICIDANSYGNEARFVRRSCNPNAEVRHLFEDNTIHLSLYSLGSITKGSEITIGFDYNFKTCTFPVRCACKKKNCGIKKFRRKHHSEDGRNHKANHIEEFRNRSNSNPGSLSPNAIKKRTVSPLRVSLAAHNAQNTQSEPNGPVNGDDNKEATTSKTEPNVQENQQSSESQEPAQPAKKLTREERKMEAIMKAIEKMEKTEKRRQQALERIATSKQQQQEKDEPGKPEESKSDKTSDAASKDEEVKGQAAKKDQQVLESEQGKSSAEESAAPAPQTAAKPRPNNRRRKKSAASRRRSRVNSAASNTTATSSAELSSMDEDTNSMAATPTPTSGTTTTSTISSPSHQLLTTVPRTPAVTTATSLSSTISAVPSSLTDSSMSSPIPGNSKHFKFPKTKKFFMNEWFNEKALEVSANKPLSIKTESLDMIAASVSSPSTPTQLSKSTPFSSLKTNLEGSLSGSLGGSMGSAKKRWLRQAMCDNNMKSNPASSGANSPVLNGTLSPHHPASPALSPNSSMNDVMMTPLKKRMLRHSIAEDRSSLSQSSTPPHVSEKAATAPSTPTPTLEVKSDEPPRLTEVKNEAEQNGSNMPSKIELSFDGFDEEKKRSVPYPLPLPARKDYRKNSSVDSGLSVTTPAELDRSPIAITATDAQTPENTAKSSPVKSGDDSVEKSVNIEERTSERTIASEASSVEIKREFDSREKESELSVQERTAKESDKAGDSSVSPVNNRPGSSGSSERPVQTDIETPVRQPPSPGGSNASSAQIRLDFSLSESQGSLSSLDKSHGSLPDLHSSCASAPELRQPPVADNKADLSHSASGASNFDWTPSKKADVHGSSNVYSTPPRTQWDKLREEDPSKVNGDLSSHARMRRLSGPVDFRRRPPSEQDNNIRRSSEGGGFSDDQISGNTSLYTSFASPKKKTLMMMRNSEALAAQEQRQRLEASQNDSRTPLPNRTDSSEKDSNNSLHPSEPSTPSRLSPSSSSTSLSSNAPTLAPSRTSFQASSPSADNTPPGPPPPTLSPHPPHGGVSPAMSSPTSGSPVLGSPSKIGVSSSSSSPAPGMAPTGALLSPAVASPPPGTPPVKRKVSLLEYRKRKTTAGKPSSSSTSSTTTSTTTTSASAPTTPIKPTVPTPTKTGLPTLPTLPIFDKSKKAVAEEATAKGRRLSLTTDAVQAITSLTSFLKDKGKPVEKKRPSTQDENWRSNKVASSSRDEDPLQKLRKELDEKNKERERRDSHNSLKERERRDSHNSLKDRERRDSHNSLKRPRSPEPPPPPPSKKPSSSHSSHQPPAKKSHKDSGLRLQIPPPPPPKVKSESRSGDTSTEGTPTKHHKSRPNLHRSPGSAGTPPVAAAAPGTPPVRKQGGIPGTPPVRSNPAAIPGTPPVIGNLAAAVRSNPAAVPGTPPVIGNLAATPPVQARPNAMHTTYQQAPAQPYNPNYGQQPQQQPQQVAQQPMQYQPGVQYPQQVQPAPQQQVPPPPPAPAVQQPPPAAIPQQHQVQQQAPPPPPPAPQQPYNYQGYQQQQSYQTPEKQGTAAVIEQFTKFHNQQQQQPPQQYQQNVYNQAYQQAAAPPPPQNYQAAPQQPYQQHYAAGQQQHATSNSYSPRQGGYYQ